MSSPLVFIGWSQDRSQKMAGMIRDWLRQVVQTSNPWFSPIDIASGAPWDKELTEALDTACFGILCVTAENYQSPWLN